MAACTKRIQHFDVPGGSVLEVETAGNPADYSTTIQVESEASRSTLANSKTQAQAREIPLPPTGGFVTVRFLTTFKSTAVTKVTLKARIKGGTVLLDCDVSGKKKDPADYRLLWLSSI